MWRGEEKENEQCGKSGENNVEKGIVIRYQPGVISCGKAVGGGVESRPVSERRTAARVSTKELLTRSEEVILEQP